MPCLRAGTVFLRPGNLLASPEKIRQYDETNPNCMSVRVAGFGKAIRMVFEEVFVNAEERYQKTQSIYRLSAEFRIMDGGRPTINFGDTGAFNACAISWAFSLTLPFRVRIVLKASPKLFCLPCPRPLGLYDVFLPVQVDGSGSLLDCHRSIGGVPFNVPLNL